MSDEQDQNTDQAGPDSGSEADERLERFSEYYEGGLSKDKRAEFEALMAEDPETKSAYEAFEKTMGLLSGMHKMSAPLDFDKKVEGTIHQRSGGRFFGRRAFGDRIPFEILAIVVMLIAAGIYWMGRTSGTGGHKINDERAPDIHEGAREVVPTR